MMILHHRIRLKVQFKLGLTFLVSFIIPVIVFGVFSIFSINGILENNLYSYQETLVNQLKNELDRYLIDIHRISRNLSYDIPFTIRLSEDDIPVITRTIGKSIESEPSISGYIVRTDKGKFYYSEESGSFLENVAERIPYQKLIDSPSALNLQRHPDNENILCTTKINITYLKEKRIGKGILVFIIDRKFLDDLIFRNSNYPTPVYLFDSEGNFIYSRNKEIFYKTLPADVLNNMVSKKTGTDKLKGTDEQYLVNFTTSRFDTIKIISLTSDSRIRSDIYFLTKSTLLFLALLLTVFIFFIILLSYSISKPVNNLQQVMKKIEDSNYSSTDILLYKRNKGLLSPYFDNLYSFLHSVIYRMNDFHQKEKEHELMILQAQINPHFVYNTLNTIRMLAERDGQPQLADAVRSLIHLLKKSIKIGTIFISINEEIEQIREYIALQMLRYRDSFRVEYDIDDTALNYRCIKYILQPLVENAIFHGIDKTSETGVISISVQKNLDTIEYIITDNGCGMPEEILNAVIRRNNKTASDGKIGIYNVNSRLTTYFGTESRLEIQSGIGKGTTVKYQIPAEKYES